MATDIGNIARRKDFSYGMENDLILFCPHHGTK